MKRPTSRREGGEDGDAERGDEMRNKK